MTPLSPGDTLADPPPRLPADHPGVNELFAVLAYGEVAAFYRLTEEASTWCRRFRSTPPRSTATTG
jgi:hypothetical protein